MKYIFILFLFPIISFPQYLHTRYFLEVFGNYRYGNLSDLNEIIDEFHTHQLVIDWFEGNLNKFENGSGLGIAIGYGISHYFTIGLRYDSIKFKNYNRDILPGTLEGDAVIVESNLNFKLTSKALTLNLIYYPFNSPLLGFSIGAGGGMIFNCKFTEKRYFTVTYEDTGERFLLLDASATYKQDRLYPLGHIFVNFDIALGILTSIILEGGYRHAIIDELKRSDLSLRKKSGEIANIDLSGYYGSIFLRFIF